MSVKILFVSAGAGSGKTYRLTQILHEQLSQGGIRPAGVIATTFTKKAAAELRERVRSHLLAQGDYGLANAMGQARIGTVNSVCGKLLDRFGFEAGLPPEQRVLEEDQASALIKQSIDAVLDGPAIASLLPVVQRLGLDEDNRWQEELKTLINQARANDIDPGQLKAFAAENARDLLAHFPNAAKIDLSASLLKEISAALPALMPHAAPGGKRNTADYVSLVRTLERGLKNGSASWSDWIKLSKKLPEAALIQVAEPINTLAGRAGEHPGLHGDITAYLEALFSLCADILVIYADTKREQGLIDFTDQEHLLLRLLDNTTVSEVLTDELDLLLVDEFQDTSPIQLALFLKLAQFAKKVYWVGDIKQAIYSFRGSDTALMEAILGKLPALGGKKEILASSWRSRPPLVSIANGVFRHAFAGLLPASEIELKPERDDSVEGLDDPAFANWMLGGSNQDHQRTALAAGIHKLVASRHVVFDKTERHARPVRYGDIAILVRLNDTVAAVTTHLRAKGIPCATSQAGLLATPEAILALACLRRLNDPSDTVATAEILSLADSLAPETWVADRLRFLEVGGDADAWQETAVDEQPPHPIVAQLGSLRRQLPLLAPAEALQTVITACDLPSRILRWSPDTALARVRLANLEALIGLASEYEDSCRNAQKAASVSGLIIWLGDKAASKQDYLASPAIDAVKVMTHHAAKGLEWPVVILMDLGANIKDRLWSISAHSRSDIDAANPLKDRFIRYWPWPFGLQARVPLADDIEQTPTAKDFRVAATEESKRLLYVSMTRARDLLVFARPKKKPGGEWLDAVDAPWLLNGPDTSQITLPDGQEIPALHWDLEPGEPSAIPETRPATLYFFEQAIPGPAKLPLVFNPSAAEATKAPMIERATVGQRIPLESGIEAMDVLGNALHACIALAFSNPGVPITQEEVVSILRNMGMADKIPSLAVFHQILALKEWIMARWGEVEAHAEYPVEAVLDNGQVIQGRIDLLLKSAAGWILLDHKSSPKGPAEWDEVANGYRGQMRSYADAIIRASGISVAEGWIFLPVAGGAVRLW